MIGENVKKIRLSSGLSQRDFAEKLGVSSGVVTNLEYNKLSSPEKKMPLLRLISETFCVPLDWILADDPGELPELAETQVQEKKTDALASNDPVVKSFLEFWAQRSEKERQQLTVAIEEFYEILMQNRKGLELVGQPEQKNTAAARSGDRMEAAELSEEEEEAVLPPPYTGDI